MGHKLKKKRGYENWCVCVYIEELRSWRRTVRGGYGQGTLHTCMKISRNENYIKF